MRKQINALVYLCAVSLLIFYGPKLLSNLGSSSPPNPSTRAAEAGMTQKAYFALRTVAGFQLDHISITYIVAEESGRYQARFQNKACPNLQADPEVLQEDFAALQDELHQQILLIGPCADTDRSGFVTENEGARFRDLFAFGHLVAYYQGQGIPGSAGTNERLGLAQAAGLTAEETTLNLRDFRKLVAGCPAETRRYFPVVGN